MDFDKKAFSERDICTKYITPAIVQTAVNSLWAQTLRPYFLNFSWSESTKQVGVENCRYGKAKGKRQEARVKRVWAILRFFTQFGFIVFTYLVPCGVSE